MKNLILGILCAMMIINNSIATEKILPLPQKSGGMPLMQALNQRRTIRSFSSKDIDDQTLSNLLWAAYGVNDDSGRRTIPTARNLKDLQIYIAKSDGVWLYDADNNKLIQVSKQNIAKLFDTQDFVKDVPLEIIFTGDRNGKFTDMHAGSAYQNIGLYAASVGLNNVVRAMVEHEKIAEAIQLPKEQKVVVTQAIGWGK